MLCNRNFIAVFFFQAEDGIRDGTVTGVQTCALPISFEPQSRTRSVSSASRYDEVPPPAPNAVARPTTLGACQVRLQLSMLLLPMATRVNFWAMKFISFVVFEQLNMPNAFGPAALALANPSAARATASSHDAGRRRPPSRTRGWVKRTLPSSML